MTQFHEMMHGSPPGTMVQHLYSVSGGADWLAGLAIREDGPTLAGLPRRIDILARGALIQAGRVHLILLMLRFAETIYETFISVQHADSAEFVARMAAQPYCSVLLFDGVAAQPVRGFVTRNGFQPLFQAVAAAYPGWPGWTDAEFDQAKAALYRRYPTVLELWQALGQQTGGVTWQLVAPGKN